ncbi:hypothetical protein EON63_19235 [archaeon]|nr:MAG: hypothetical protein EON63_19235 [archaeon]
MYGNGSWCGHGYIYIMYVRTHHIHAHAHAHSPFLFRLVSQMPKNLDQLKRIFQLLLDKLEKGGRVAVPSVQNSNTTPPAGGVLVKEGGHK